MQNMCCLHIYIHFPSNFECRLFLAYDPEKLSSQEFITNNFYTFTCLFKYFTCTRASCEVSDLSNSGRKNWIPLLFLQFFVVIFLTREAGVAAEYQVVESHNGKSSGKTCHPFEFPTSPNLADIHQSQSPYTFIHSFVHSLAHSLILWFNGVKSRVFLPLMRLRTWLIYHLKTG